MVLGLLAGLAAAPCADAQEPARAAVVGTVTDAAGSGIAGARVAATAPDGFGRDAFTDDAGRFRLELPAGPRAYSLTVSSPSHSTAERGPLELAPGQLLRVNFQLADQPIRLPAVEVISAAPDALEGVAGSTAVLDRKTLETSRPVAASEVVRRVPGVHVKDDDAFGLALNIGVRGLDPRRSSRTLVLEDGAPIHLGPYGDPSARYHPPVAILERVEVLKGSGQILHGPHTVGAVVNFVTSTPPTRAGGSLSLSGGTRDFLSGHIRLGGGWSGSAAVLDYVHEQGRGIRAGEHHRVDDVAVKGVLGLGTPHSLSLKGGYYVDDSRGGEAALRQAEFEAGPFGSPFRHNAYLVKRSAGQAIHEMRLSESLSLKTNLYGQHASFTTWRQAGSSEDRLGSPGYAEAFNCRPGATSLEECGNQGRPRTYVFGGIEPRLSALVRLLGALTHVEAGGRVHLEWVERKQFTGASPGARSGELTRDNEIRSDALSLFVQGRSAAGPWSVVPGLRVEHVGSRNANRVQASTLEDDYTQWLPGLGVTFNGVRDATVFAGAHRGFAPPRPADVLDPEPGQGLVQVDPEVSWNYELGARAEPAPGIDAALTVFRIDFANQVVRGDLVGAGQSFVNAGETRHQGVEVSGGIDLAKLLGSASGPYGRLAYTNLHTAEFSEELLSSVDGATPIRGNRLPYAPEHLVSLTLGYALSSGLEVQLDVDHVSEQFADDLNTLAGSENGQRGLIPAYTVANAAVSTLLEALDLTLFLSVKNLTDELYISDRQEGIVPGAPRLLRAGARWTF